MPPENTSWEVLKISSCEEWISFGSHPNELEPKPSSPSPTLSASLVKHQINGLTFRQASVFLHNCKLSRVLSEVLSMNRDGIFSLSHSLLHPLLFLMGLTLVLKDIKKDASDGGRKCGGWVGLLRHSCATELMDFMAMGANKLHPPPSPTRVHLPSLTRGSHTHRRVAPPPVPDERVQHLR